MTDTLDAGTPAADLAPRRILFKIALRVFLVLLVAFIVAAGFEAYRVASDVMGITGQKVARVQGEPTFKTLPTLAGTKRINILLLGTANDRKADEKSEPDADTMMVVTIDPVHRTVGMLSIPRDFWVNIRGHGYNKINAAYTFGGIQLARATVERQFSIPIHYYAWIGLDGFIKVVDTLGGVIVNAAHPVLDDTFPDDLNPQDPYAYTRVYIPAGPQYMDGSTALEYVRSRHGDLIGDFGRGARQEQVLLGLRSKATTLNVLVHLPDLASELNGSVKTDMSVQQLWSMATFARSLNPATIQHIVLGPPRYSWAGWAGPASVVYPIWRPIHALIKRMFAEPVIAPGHPYHPKTKIKVQTGGPTAHPTGNHHTPSKPTATPVPVVPFSGHIFFARDGNIWSYNGAGSTQLTTTNDASDPTVTMNGTKLAFVRRWSPVVSDIFTLNLKTHRWGQITQDRTTDGDVSNNVWAFDPQYAPDGLSIVYASDAYKLQNPVSDAREIDLALYRYDTATDTTGQPLTTPGTGAGGNANPRFDPANPQHVLYTSYYYQPQTAAVAAQLTLLNLGTDTVTPLTPASEQDLQPTWQPNGHHLAYVQNQGQGNRLLIAPFNHGALHTRHAVQVDSGMVAMPTFSPDGRHLAYYKVVNNAFQMWIVDLQGGRPIDPPRPLMTISGLDATSPIVWTR